MTLSEVFEKRDFFTGQRYRRVEDQKPSPGLARDLDFATGGKLEPVKKLQSFPNCLIWKTSDQISVAQMYH